jgi:hypothetical protein
VRGTPDVISCPETVQCSPCVRRLAPWAERQDLNPSDFKCQVSSTTSTLRRRLLSALKVATLSEAMDVPVDEAAS